MKIFFDGNIFSQQKIGGISRLGFELIRGLSAKKDIEKTFYRGFYIDGYSFKKEWFKNYFGIRKPNFIGGKILSLLNNIGLKFFYNINAEKDLIYHSLYYRIPKNPKGPIVVHAYDMIQELFGGSKKTIEYKKRAFDAADLIISISESTKKDLCRIHSINPEKIIVAYPGVNEKFFEQHSPTIRQRPYMLYIGSRNYKYKNFDTLLDVFVSKEYFKKFDLVVVGGEKIGQTIGREWLVQEFCDDEKLAELYSGAKVFVYPSLYEGFGIPPLEAMACGCPVIASNASSIPEVVGDAALLFDPKDKNELARQIDRVIDDEALIRELITKGKERAARFTWKNMADKVYDSYKKLV